MNKPWEITRRDWVPHKEIEFPDPFAKYQQRAQPNTKVESYRQPGYFGNKKVIPDNATADASSTPPRVASQRHNRRPVRVTSKRSNAGLETRYLEEGRQEQIESDERINQWLGELPPTGQPQAEPAVHDLPEQPVSRVSRVVLPRHDAIRKPVALRPNHHIFKLKNKMLASKPADMLKTRQITETRLHNVSWNASRQRPLLARVNRVIV